MLVLILDSSQQVVLIKLLSHLIQVTTLPPPHQFVPDAIDEPLMEGPNEACIACHTKIGVNVTWTKSERINFTATKGKTGNWSILAFTAEGTNICELSERVDKTLNKITKKMFQ